jgi:hypothetical protein
VNVENHNSKALDLSGTFFLDLPDFLIKNGNLPCSLDKTCQKHREAIYSLADDAFAVITPWLSSWQ